MSKTMTLEEFRELLAETVALAWFRLYGVKQAFMLDTFQELLEKLKENSRSWADTAISSLVQSEQLETGLWNLLRKVTRATENPLGVLRFSSQPFATALQWREGIWRKAPLLVEFVEEILPNLA